MSTRHDYRQALLGQLTQLGLPQNLDYAKQWVTSGWDDVGGQAEDETQIATRIWGGIGMLAFGLKGHLGDLTALMVSHPTAMRLPMARQAVGALRQILPLSEELIPINNPEEFREWAAACADRLQWDDERGYYLLRN